jgi:hypothetical protein
VREVVPQDPATRVTPPAAELVAAALPVYVISFNNPTHVASMVGQLRSRAITAHIVIVDNASTYPPMLELLAAEEAVGTTVIRMAANYGHKVVYTHVATPERYVLTDPDLVFHPDMPADVLTHLVRIADRQRCREVGLALQLPAEGLVHIDNYFGTTLRAWESRAWKTRVPDPRYELYLYPTDTTFKLVTKAYTRRYARKNDVRVAGVFAARHDPWYIVPQVPVPAEERACYARTQTCSSICRFGGVSVGV